MKKTLLTILAIGLASLVTLAMFKPGGDDRNVTLSQVSSKLSAYEGNETYDFVGDTIMYKYVGMDKYDDVFRESAIIYATTIQVNKTLKGIDSGEIPMDAKYAVELLAFALADLPDMKDRAGELMNDAKSLNPKDDFKGLKARKAPTATKGLSIAQKQLKASIEMLPGLIEQVNEMSK